MTKCAGLHENKIIEFLAESSAIAKVKLRAFSGALRAMAGLKHPEFHSVVAEIDGRMVGSNFLGGRNTIADVGSITVDPMGQNRTVSGFAVRWYLGEALFGIGWRRCCRSSSGFITPGTLSHTTSLPGNLSKQTVQASNLVNSEARVRGHLGFRW